MLQKKIKIEKQSKLTQIWVVVEGYKGRRRAKTTELAESIVSLPDQAFQPTWNIQRRFVNVRRQIRLLNGALTVERIQTV